MNPKSTARPPDQPTVPSAQADIPLRDTQHPPARQPGKAVTVRPGQDPPGARLLKEAPVLLQRLMRAPELGVAVAAIVIFVFFAIVGGSKGFLSLTATASWLNTAAQLGIIAIPLGLLMISGSFDLSIGSMVGAGSVTVGIVTGYEHQSLWLALVIAAGIAVLVGLGNGLLVTRTALPSFIVSLGANLIVAGLGLTVALQMTGTTSIPVTASGFAADLFDSKWHQLSVSTFWWLGIAVAAAWVLAHTRFGNWITATGGDPEKARRAGVLTGRVTITLFIFTALSSAFVGVLQAVQYTSGDPTTGQNYVFQAAIVVVIGGVLISGGYGTILGVVLGTLVYGIVNGGLFYTGWNTNYTEVLIGLLMIVAVLTNSFLRRLALSATKKGVTR
jgi:simple sugar transport system permease protein